MAGSKDFKELFELLNKHKVEYLIVGGYALAFHGAPRFTGDMDIYVNPYKLNAEKLLQALDAFGFGELGLSADDFITEGQIIQLGYPPSRIDLLTSISGVQWIEADAEAEAGDYFGVAVRYIGFKQFIKNKQATGRHKDLADIEAITKD